MGLRRRKKKSFLLSDRRNQQNVLEEKSPLIKMEGRIYKLKVEKMDDPVFASETNVRIVDGKETWSDGVAGLTSVGRIRQRC